MKNKPAIILAACALFLNACDDSKSNSSASESGDSPDAAPAAVTHPLPGDPIAGEPVYMRICAACHQKDGSGMNGMLAANFVTDKTRLAKTNEELLTSIRNGIIKDGKVMPPQKGILTDQEMKDVLSYIRKTFGSQ